MILMIAIHFIDWITICFINFVICLLLCQCHTKHETDIVFSNLKNNTFFLYYLRTFIFLTMNIDFYVVLLGLLGFIGGFLISIPQFLIRLFLNGPYFTLFLSL